MKPFGKRTKKSKVVSELILHIKVYDNNEGATVEVERKKMSIGESVGLLEFAKTKMMLQEM